MFTEDEKIDLPYTIYGSLLFKYIIILINSGYNLALYI